MGTHRIVSCLAFLLLVGLSLTGATYTPLKPTKSFETSFQVKQPPTLPFEAVQSVVDFPVGGFVARHTHGGPLYAVMTKGSITLWIDGEPERTYYEGESLEEPYRNVSSAGNLGTKPASLLANYLIPVGAQLTVFEPAAPSAAPTSSPPPPGPSSRFQSRMRLDSAPEHYMVRLFLLTYEPSAWMVPEMVVAPRLLTVVSGEVTLFSSAGEKKYKAGECWIERPGELSLVSGNLGSEKAVVAVSVVPT